MTCNQLGGACEQVFSGETFDDLAAQSQQHGKEMYGANDGPHMAAMGTMMELMKSGQMDSWMAARKAEFETLWIFVKPCNAVWAILWAIQKVKRSLTHTNDVSGL